MTEDELDELKIKILPRNLEEAMAAMADDALVCDTLGQHIMEHLSVAKKMEWRQYIAAVHAWEIDRYLDVF
jgi:glutamine synthetase